MVTSPDPEGHTLDNLRLWGVAMLLLCTPTPSCKCYLRAGAFNYSFRIGNITGSKVGRPSNIRVKWDRISSKQLWASNRVVFFPSHSLLPPMKCTFHVSLCMYLCASSSRHLLGLGRPPYPFRVFPFTRVNSFRPHARRIPKKILNPGPMQEPSLSSQLQ